MWYDKKGKLICPELKDELTQEWIIGMKEVEKLIKDREYKVVKQEVLSNGMWVSTIQLGLNHEWDSKKPILIFETMVFPSKENYSELDMERYTTEKQAIAGHKKMVNKWKKEKLSTGDLDK